MAKETEEFSSDIDNNDHDNSEVDDEDSSSALRVHRQVVDLRGQNLKDWKDLLDLVHREEAKDSMTFPPISWKVLFLQRNAFTHFKGLENCTALRFLDISKNHLKQLPAKDFWISLPNLEVLFLHNNLIQSVASLQSFSAIPKLLALTIYGNPVASRPSCRHIIANSNSSIKLIDDFLVSDQELMEGAVLGNRFGTLSSFLQIPRFRSHSLVIEKVHLDIVQDFIDTVHEKHALNSPIILVQRFFRKKRQFMKNRRLSTLETEKSTSTKKTTFQPKLIKKNVNIAIPNAENERKTSSTPKFSGIVDISKQSLHRRGTQQTIQSEANSIMLVSNHSLSRALLNRFISKAESLSGTKLPSSSRFEDTDTYLLSEPTSLRLEEALFRRSHKKRTFEMACAMHNICGEGSKPGFTKLKRRMCIPGFEQTDALLKGWKKWSPGPDGRRLIKFACPDKSFQETVLKLVAEYNTKSGHSSKKSISESDRNVQPELIVFTFTFVERSHAALVIQTCWRRHLTRVLLGYTVSRALLRRRARLALLVNFRMHLLRTRFRFLQAARQACSLDSPVCFVSHHHINLLSTAPNPFVRSMLFPEHKWLFDVVEERASDEAMSLESGFAHPNSKIITFGLRPPEGRKFIVPEWFGWNLKNVVQHQETYLSSSSLRERMGKLLVWGVNASTAPVDEPESNGGSSMWKIEFRSVEEARLRAFLLFTNSWEPITGSFCQLVPSVERNGHVVPKFKAMELPSSYAEISDLNKSTKPQSTGQLLAPQMIGSTNFNAKGLLNLIESLDQYLDRLSTHDIPTPDAVTMDHFVLDNKSTCESARIQYGFEDGIANEMKEQAENLRVTSFDPALVLEDEIIGKSSVEKRKQRLAELSRDESLHMELLRHDLNRKRLTRFREIYIQSKRDKCMALKAIAGARSIKVKPHNHSIEAQKKKEIQIQNNMTIADRARLRKEQFRKDKTIDDKTTRSERRQLIAREKAAIKLEMRQIRESDEWNKRHLKMQRLVRDQRRQRKEEARKFALHFARQKNQIEKHSRAGMLESKKQEMLLNTSRQVKERKLDTSRRRELIHDSMIIDFNKRRQNAIVQHMETQDQIEHKRIEREQKLEVERAKRQHLRELRLLFERESAESKVAAAIKSTREKSPTHLETGQMMYESIEDADLAAQIDELEGLANTVRDQIQSTLGSTL